MMAQSAIGQQFVDAAEGHGGSGVSPSSGHPWCVMSASGSDATQATVGPCTCTHVRNRR
ncbi:hypothetical protein DAD186_03220 [Dermabacter vaginalis]|uniref:Uncharacterized protein n=1 Tax=Dermabacter vaginalis TaxID=1630135 RepID=A0A1B0ZG11_9MICO|nr:hypothetical protein DAD186_03220 [Dermabacter vaginalis]